MNRLTDIDIDIDMAESASNQAQISPLPPHTNHITTHNPSGAAIFHSSDPAKWVPLFDNQMAFNVVYTTSAFPAQFSGPKSATGSSGAAEPAGETSSGEPAATPANDLQAHEALMAQGGPELANPDGTVCRVVDFAPDCPAVMHRTQSLDYGVILEGEFELLLESESEGEGEGKGGGEKRVVKKGDVVVQRGTMHAWKNITPVSRCLLCFFMMMWLVSGRGREGAKLMRLQNHGWGRMFFVLTAATKIVLENGKTLGEDLEDAGGEEERMKERL